MRIKTKIGRSVGFTLVEVMLSLICMIIVTAAILSMFSGQNKMTINEQDIIEMQDNSRLAMDRLASIFSLAGYGVRDSFLNGQAMTGSDPVLGASTINTVFSSIVNNPVNATASDSVVVCYGFKNLATVTTVTPGASPTVRLNQAPSPALATTGFKGYLCFFPSTRPNTVYQVTSTSGNATNDYVLASVDSVDVNASAHMVVPVRILVNNTTLQVQNFAYNSDFDWDIADFVDAFQLEYSTDGTTFAGTVAAGDLNDIKAVRFSLLVRAKRPDRDYTNTHVYTLAGVGLPAFNDNFRRTILQRTIWVRNSL